MKENKPVSTLAKGLEKLAVYSAVETVGKSFPLMMHEVELSEDLRKKIISKKN